MGLTNFPNGVSSFGIPLMGGGGIPATFGDVWFVDPTNGSDNNTGKSADRAVASIGKAHTLAATNNNDVIVLEAYAAHAQTEMLTISKNRLHFVSASGRAGWGMGARTRVTMGVTTAATDIAVMKNTGVGNTFTGIKFDSANTVDEGLYAVAEGGEYAIYTGCEFYKSTDLDETAAAEVLNNGDSAQWINCVFGSSANIIADNKIRPNMLLTATLSGKKCRDNMISNCVFLSKAGGTEHVAIYGANATDVERLFYVKDSLFYNNILSAATPAHAVGFGAAQTEGCVILKNCTSVDHTVMKEASRNIYVDGAVPTHNTTGVSVTG
jgi:hypothetical protein